MRVVLITGAFSGIGMATALAFARAGWIVYASGRALAKSAALVAQAESERLALRCVVLDVTDEASITAAIMRIGDELGRLDVVVNNAGFAVHGAVTEVSTEQMRRQFETNTIGALAVSRAALGLMRRHQCGRIINISSVLGKTAYPGSGIYSASKFALEAASDAMRLELKLAGPDYRVVVIEMPEIATELGVNAVYAEFGDQPESMYGDFNTMLRNYVDTQAYTNRPGPEVVARVILKAATAPNPRPRYTVTLRAWLTVMTRRLLPDRAYDVLLLSQTPQLRRIINSKRRAASRATLHGVVHE